MIKKSSYKKIIQNSDYIKSLHNVLDFMDSNCITQTDVANVLGCTRQNIHAVLRECKSFNPDLIDRLKKNNNDAYKKLGVLFEKLNATRNSVYWKNN